MIENTCKHRRTEPDGVHGYCTHPEAPGPISCVMGDHGKCDLYEEGPETKATPASRNLCPVCNGGNQSYIDALLEETDVTTVSQLCGIPERVLRDHIKHST